MHFQEKCGKVLRKNSSFLILGSLKTFLCTNINIMLSEFSCDIVIIFWLLNRKKNQASHIEDNILFKYTRIFVRNLEFNLHSFAGYSSISFLKVQGVADVGTIQVDTLFHHLRLLDI